MYYCNSNTSIISVYIYIYISIVTYYKYTSVDGITIHSCITIRKLTQYKN